MSNIFELIELWRNRSYRIKDNSGGPEDFSCCANELQSYIESLWTEITDDPVTWPPERTPFALQYSNAEFSKIYADVLHDTIRQYFVSRYFTAKWRPIIPGIDTVERL